MKRPSAVALAPVASAPIAAVLSLLAAQPALAHPGHLELGLAAGLIHPFSGLDHMLAMTAVGLFAAIKGGKAMIIWPLGFVAAMLVGYGCGVAHPGLTMAEPAILASVIVLGVLVAAMARAPFAVGLGLIAVFGLAHGYAHGSEAPAGGGLAFPVGFAVSTAVLHLTGLAVGALALRLRRPAVLRALGAATALGGVALAFAG
jgi:urease accessory protein